MTADDLQTIALRHADNEHWLPSRCKADPSALAGSALLAHEERGLLLALLRQVANWQAIQEAPGGGEGCAVCWRAPDDHAADCWWNIAQGAK